MAVVFNAANVEAFVYLNGAQDAKRTHLPRGAPVDEEDGRLVIGHEFTSHNTDGYSSVTVDELMFFDTPLTAEEIMEIYMFYQSLGV